LVGKRRRAGGKAGCFQCLGPSTANHMLVTLNLTPFNPFSYPPIFLPPSPQPAVPKLPPEEERKLLAQKKKLATAESTRELLETQYMSLRAHYVAASQRLAASRLGTDAINKNLQGLVERRAAAMAYRR